MSKIIGVHGKRQTGKDTVAKYIVDNYGFKRLAFADELKRHMYILNPLVNLDDNFESVIPLRYLVDSIGWDKAKEDYREVRRLLQDYGTEVVRDNFGNNFWVDFVFSRIKKENIDKAVISDLRFPNEIEKVIQENGITIKIKSIRPKYKDTHASEQDLPDFLFDHIIENNGTLEELHDKIKIVMSRHK